MASAPLKPVIYQLVVRYFGNTNPTNARDGALQTNGCGKFDDISDLALAAVRALGVTHIWLTGCLRQATLTTHGQLGLPADDPDVVKGIAGSLYAIRDYFDVSPDYARVPQNRMTEFEALLARIHAAGMKALIDFVPNHVARGYASLSHPQLDFGRGDDQSHFFDPANHFFYLQQDRDDPLELSHPPHWQPPGVAFDGRFAPEDGSPGHAAKATGDVTTHTPPHDSWYEVAKLNYGWNHVEKSGHYEPRPKTWSTMDAVLEFWQGKGVDGFRCDMAHLIPPEAWSFLLGEAKRRNAQTFFMAEAYFWSSDVPSRTRAQLLDCGFDAIYHDDSYDELVKIYREGAPLDVYDAQMRALSERERAAAVEYLENHDESRVAAAVADGGFGSLAANYQLAPLQMLYSSGPVIVLNGQEAGEPGDGVEGFHDRIGRTTFFDYWCMPEFARWVNGHRYDGGTLSPEQTALRRFLGDLLRLCQHPSVRGSGYWGLRYANREDGLYPFTRYEPGAGTLLVVAANFRPGATLDARLRVPADLASAAGLQAQLRVRRILSRGGAESVDVGSFSSAQLASDGFEVTLASHESHVYTIA